MSTEQALSLASATVFLAIAVVAVLRRARSSLAIYVSLMCVSLFAYNAGDVVSAVTGHQHWDWLEDAAAALALVSGLPVVIGFIGMGRRLRWFVRLTVAYFGALSLTSLGSFIWPGFGRFSGSSAWALCMLTGGVIAYVTATGFLVRHIRRSRAEERARAQLMLGAVLIGVGFPSTDLAAMAGGSVPRLSYLGFLAQSLLVAALVLKAKLFDRMSVLTVVNAIVVAVLAVVAQLLVFAWVGTRPGLLLLGSLIIVLALTAALRPLLRTLAEHRARVTYHATLGQLADQMAHDIRNPVAAIRGAAQYLQEEHHQGRVLDPHVVYLDLIVERTERLERVISDYQRMARVEPAFASIDLNALVEQVVTGSAAASAEGIEIRVDLAPESPRVSADADLLSYALENVVRNAAEAMPDGGTLTVSTELASPRSVGRPRACIRVTDTGQGMDVRVQERAFDPFYTTKSEGSGLGLPFVARVARAHGGDVSITSGLGLGTTVELELPIES